MISTKIGEKAIRTDKEGYTKLIEFYYKCNGIHGEQILIGFEDLTWIDANMSALLMSIIDKLTRENGLTFFVDSEIIKQKFNILIRNGWLAGVEFIPNSNKTAIRLTGFDKNQDEKFIRYIDQELLSHENLLIEKSDKDKLTDSLLELFCNIEKHAKTEAPIFACGQYYPTYERLSFTLVDSGVGYLPPIKDFTNGMIQTAQEAISWAIQGNSTKKDAPGGLGLKQIQKFCEENGSRFEIITGDAYWTNYQLFPVKVKEFCGTIVNVIFDCKRA